MYLVINKMSKLHHIDLTDGNTAVKGLSRPAVKEYCLAILGGFAEIAYIFGNLIHFLRREPDKLPVEHVCELIPYGA